MFRRKPPSVDLTPEAYARWMRAGRPPEFRWFLALSEGDQEALAVIGDQYTQDLCIAVGYAVQNPQAAEAGLDAVDNVNSEETLVRELAASMVRDRMSGSQEPPVASSPAEPLSMGGVTERREKARTDAQRMKSGKRSFLGRKPDNAEPIRGC